MSNNKNSYLDNNISTNFLPRIYRSNTNKKFLQATLDQLIQPGSVQKINGFIGRQNSKASTSNDVFINSATNTRQNYQLEPSLVIKDSLDNVTFFKDYQDYINQLDVLGGIVNNHARLNEQEFYSWNPYICWDKFINFQKYYWVPNGPMAIPIDSQPLKSTSTYTVVLGEQSTTRSYIFSPDSEHVNELNPTITLYRGHVYYFEINSPGNPFGIRLSINGDYYLDGVSTSSVETGIIKFTVPDDAPDTLYYQSDIDSQLNGIFNIASSNNVNNFNIEDDLLGKKTYSLTLSNGFDLSISNGIKLSFKNNVEPEQYKNKSYYVEGVGTSIKLIPVDQLELFNKDLSINENDVNSSNVVYVVISRSNQTYNQWSRYNRWFHQDTLDTSARYHNEVLQLSQTARATRPIIEFDGELKLFNYGTKFIDDIDLYDEYTKIPAHINNTLGYYIDGYNIADLITSNSQGYIRVLFKSDNNIYKISLTDQLKLTVVIDNVINEDQVVLVKQGKIYSDTVFWCTKNNLNSLYWKQAQYKSNIDKNQAPLFDVFGQVDDQMISFGDTTQFNSTTFAGTKLFSYKLNANGIEDSILKLKLSYKNIENSGDIVFNFDFDLDTFSYKNDIDIQQNVNLGFLQKRSITGNVSFVNGWETSTFEQVQPAIRIYKNFNLSIKDEDKNAKEYKSSVTYYPGDIVRGSDNNLYRVKIDGSVLESGIIDADPIDTANLEVWDYYGKSLLTLNNFDLDIFDDKNNLDDLKIQVYLNSIRLPEYKWFIEDGLIYKKIVLDEPIKYADVLTIKAFARQPINSKGYYQIPINLQQNPLNQSIQSFTFGEIVDHVKSIVDNYSIDNPEITEDINLYNNLRNLGNVSPYGTKFIQHSGPLSLSLYHITNETNNIIKAIIQNCDDYNKFKRSFITTAETLGVDTDVITHVNLILQELNNNKPTTFPYYLSDMVAYGAYNKLDFEVIDYRIKQFPLTFTTTPFNLTTLSNQAIYVYLNNVQLCYDREYTFTDQGFVEIKIDLQTGDQISVYEYDTTDSSFIPETPTKLGLWPKYEPKIYWDTTLVTPRMMIQGHDGSLTLAYGNYPNGVISQLDYRDELLLELEKRIYNNIKVSYNSNLFDINDIIPIYDNLSKYTRDEFNTILSSNFYRWTSLIGRDFTKQLSFDENNEFTFNYDGYTTLSGDPVPRYWRGIYQWLLGTDRPHLCPWEMLGFSEEPVWWRNQYGPAPYTSNNLLMWKDISLGIINNPANFPIQIKKYIKTFLLDHLPVDQNGNLIGPLTAGLVKGSALFDNKKDFVFGDVSPVEAAWRRSSFYPFSVINAALLMFPAKLFGVLLDTSRITRNINNQIIYTVTNSRIRPSDIVLPNIIPGAIRKQTSGIINYLTNYIISDKLKSFDQYTYDLNNTQIMLSYRIGGFTSKEKFNLLLDSKSPIATGNVFIPKEDYNIFLNSSSPIKKISYSGVIITRLPEGYEVKGYIRSQPYFKCYTWTISGQRVNVGGISESYLVWEPNQQYTAGKIVEYDNKFYRVKTNHISSSIFEISYYQILSSLPIIGGRDAIFRKEWDRTSPIIIPYGTVFYSIQDVVDFLLGYGEWLKDQGFVFDQFNNNINDVLNWETSAKEFLFWTTQNWSTGQDKWDEWDSETAVSYQSIVKFNGDYYRAIRNVPAGKKPNENDQYNHIDIQYYDKLDGLSTVGSSVISLSPAAYEIAFKSSMSIVDDIRNQFYDYEVFSVNGTPIAPNTLTFYREDNNFGYSSKINEGIYGATFYLIQKEQVVIINNNTIFNDLIYSPSTGYKQDRIKVSGYVSIDWNGGFNAPGFIFDQAKIQDWTPWIDYALGDMVKFKEFFYSARTFVPGSLEFNSSQWIQIDNIPSSQLIPNWTYKATQFTDFHSLDSDNFDSNQQKMAQHLIGYQKREYLNNIIKDDVSEFKFYQGMIIEKGTQNVFNKLFDALAATDQEGMEFYEEWALRVGRYGAISNYETIEFILDESKFKSNPQGFELINFSVDQDISTDFIIRQSPADIYLTPLDYTSTPFPLAKHYKSFFRSAGSVQEKDVQFVYQNLDELVSQDINNFNDGSYIWCTFVETSWNIYKFVINNHVFNISQNDNTWTISLMLSISLEIGDYIGLINLGSNSGFYQITDIIDERTIKVKASKSVNSLPIIDPNQVKLAELIKQRIDYFDLLAQPEIAYNIFTKKLKRNNLLWVEGDLSTPHSTWIYDPVYTKSSLWNYFPEENTQFGKAIAVNRAGTISAIATNLGKIFIFDRKQSYFQWTQRYDYDLKNKNYDGTGKNLIYPVDINSPELKDEEYFEVLAMSKDGRWLAASTPTAKQIKLSSYNNVYVCSDTNVYNFKSQGVVSLYKKQALTNKYELVFTFASPDCTLESSHNEKFGSSLVFGNNILYIGAINYSHNNVRGKVYSLTYYDGTWTYGQSYVGAETYYDFGYKIAINDNNSILVISAINTRTNNGEVTFYNAKNTSELLTIKRPISNLTELFGYDIAFSLTGNYIAISSKITNGVDKGQGIVYVYSFDLGTRTSTEQQKITRLITPNIPGFGDKVAFLNKNISDILTIAYDKHIIVGYDVTEYSVDLYDLELNVIDDKVILSDDLSTMYSNYTTIGYDISAYDMTSYDFDLEERVVTEEVAPSTDTLIIYDSYNTMGYDNPIYDVALYDNELYPFELNGFGLINVYDIYFKKWVRSEVLATVFDNVFNVNFGDGFAVSKNAIIAGAPTASDYNLYQSGQVFEFQNKTNTLSWTIKNVESFVVDAYKIKRAFLYNRKTNKLITNLDVVDCFQGKIPGIADQEIKFKTYYDPAIYSNLSNLEDDTILSTKVNNNTINIDNTTSWAKDHVGTLWWDLKKTKFINVYDKDIVYRNSFQNALVVGGSIDIYEWVESNYKPSEWNELADTEEGYASGISGISLYDDTVYSVVKKYDKISKSYKSLYYFWVKNKKITPNILSRKLSGYDVANLISNARGQDYRYLTITGVNSFSLVNIEKLLISNDVVLSIDYWTNDQTTQNSHAEWQLISNEVTSQIPVRIEQKWFDSLVGKNTSGLAVPNLSLPNKIRYGIENRPQQGMFINRFEALKELIDYANTVLIKNNIVLQRDISKLYNRDEPPTFYKGQYDFVIDDYAELAEVNTQNIKTAILDPIIINGKISTVNIVNSGQGYGKLLEYTSNKWHGPNIIVIGNGKNAVIKSIIGNNGEVIETLISESGEGYDTNTRLVVRDFSVLVNQDTNSQNKWSVYSYNIDKKQWSKTLSQAYDISDYWSTIDWYASGYDQFSAATYAVDSFADINSINAKINELVKIRNGDGDNWILLKRYSTINSINWNDMYEIVGSQNGTIQLNSKLYGAGYSIGYDGTFYDSALYDNIAFEEIRIILTVLRDDIFINELRQEYLNLFFTSLRYVLSEQNYIDWAFKTSFIKAKHNVGSLSQRITYKNDNLGNYEDYIAEVKPYRTKIREYISCYSQIDDVNLGISDFDLMSVTEDQKLKPIATYLIDDPITNKKVILSDSNLLTIYPWKYWYDNYKPFITKIEVISRGQNYKAESTTVKIIGVAEEIASATAIINEVTGSIETVIINNPGQGYYLTPSIEIIDSDPTSNASGASAIATIGSNVRSSKIGIKFDRIGAFNQFEDLEEFEEFEFMYDPLVNSISFELNYLPSNKIQETSIYLNNIEIFDDMYLLKVEKVIENNHINFLGKLTIFNITNLIKTTGTNKVTIRYYRDQAELTATDRISYYSPSIGELGKDFSQLMTGIDYGGVSINGLNFIEDTGWDSVPFYTNRWDSFDESFSDYTFVTTEANTHIIKLPFIPNENDLFNVYYVNSNEQHRIDDINFNKQWTATSTNTQNEIILNVNSNPITFNVGNIIQFTGSTFGNIIPNIRYYIKDILNNNTIKISTIENGDVFNLSSASGEMTLVPIIESNKIIPTWVGNGIQNEILIPESLLITPGDKFIVRKVTSDGSLKPYGLDYDVDIDGGNISYSSAKGILASDIIIDGDEFYSSISCPTLEEVVSGHVVDTVSIKVYDKLQQNSNNSANVRVDRFIASGTKKIFNLSQVPNDPSSILVKINDTIKEFNIDYIYNQKNNAINFILPPEKNAAIAIFSIGFTESVLGVEYEVATGNQTYIFKHPYSIITYQTPLVYINGILENNIELVEYPVNGQLIVYFYTSPPINAIITVLFVSSDVNSFSITRTERFTGNSTNEYPLSYDIGHTLPYESNILVRINQEILYGPSISTFTITSDISLGEPILSYQLDSNEFLYDMIVLPNRIITIVDNNQLIKDVDYFVNVTVDSIIIEITLATFNLYQDKILSVVVLNEYTYIPKSNSNLSKLVFEKSYTNENIIEVTSSYNHNILNIQRDVTKTIVDTSTIVNPIVYRKYTSIASGLISLDRTIIDENHIWVMQNKKLLTPVVDYKLNEDKQSIQLVNLISEESVFDLMVFDSNPEYGIAYMQFKDMLNRTHFVRLNQLKQTKLVKELRFNDLTIEVENARYFDIPNRYENKPGIIEINGEHIEYFSINGNILSGLRRGILGTGVAEVYPVDTVVQEISYSEYIPYGDSLLIDESVYNGTLSLQLNNINTNISNDTIYKGLEINDNIELKQKLMNNSIDVFVGGYISSPWNSNTHYIENELVRMCGYTYRCISDHISSNSFKSDFNLDKWEFFVENIRLIKNQFTMHNYRFAPTSPAGDIEFDADYAIENNTVNLNDRFAAISLGTKIKIIRRTGLDWDGLVNIQNFVSDDSTENSKVISSIAKFIKSVPGSTISIIR